MLIQEQYLEVSSAVSKDSLFFGLGETTPSQGLPLTRKGSPITLWNRDRPSRFPDENLYGSFPFLMELRPGLAHIQCNAGCTVRTNVGIP